LIRDLIEMKPNRKLIPDIACLQSGSQRRYISAIRDLFNDKLVIFRNLKTELLHRFNPDLLDMLGETHEYGGFININRIKMTADGPVRSVCSSTSSVGSALVEVAACHPSVIGDTARRPVPVRSVFPACHPLPGNQSR
jgi:hypothetical protein